jgi:hypothetical protein
MNARMWYILYIYYTHVIVIDHNLQTPLLSKFCEYVLLKFRTNFDLFIRNSHVIFKETLAASHFYLMFPCNTFKS